jgi:CRP-like cAMP-binding protein
MLAGRSFESDAPLPTDSQRTPPPSACARCPLRLRDAFLQKAPEEVEWLQKLKQGQQRVAAGADLFRTADANAELYTLYSGWAFRYRELPDGRRQILNFYLPGDLIGFQAALIGPAEHSVAALTDAWFCLFRRTKVWRLFQDYPELAFQMTWLGAREEGMVDDGLTAVGQLSAAERMSAIIVGLFKRARALGMVADDAFEFPLRREHLADALGLSLVHTIKTWSALRHAGLFEQTGARLRVVNPRFTPTLTAFYEQDRKPRPIL